MRLLPPTSQRVYLTPGTSGPGDPVRLNFLGADSVEPGAPEPVARDPERMGGHFQFGFRAEANLSYRVQ